MLSELTYLHKQFQTVQNPVRHQEKSDRRRWYPTPSPVETNMEWNKTWVLMSYKMLLSVP